MTVTRVNSAALKGAATSGTITVTIPGGTGILAGDLIVCSCLSNGTHVLNGMTVQDSVNATNYTALLEQQESSGSSFYLDSKYYQTPAAIPDGATFTFTPFAAYTIAAIAIDVFRGCTGGIDKAATGATAVASVTIAAPALGGNATAGALVISLAAGGGAFTLTVASPFTAGSVNTATRNTGIGYVLAATGSSTYAVNWTQGTSSSWAAETVSFAACSSGPAFTQLPRPVQARFPLPPRGRCASNPGGQVNNPTPGPVFRQATTPARIRPALPPRGRAASSPGAPVRNPLPPPPVYPLHGPVVTAYRPLPPRGRTSGSRGGPVRNPHSGPPVYPLRRPVGNAYRAPGPFRKGSAQGGTGAPVYHGAPVLTTGIPYIQWATGTPATQWSVP